MSRDNVVPFQRPRRGASSDAPRREPVSERLLCVFAGSIIVSVGWGLIIFVISFAELRQMLPIDFIFILPMALIGLFGASWIIQGIRGRTRHEGIFYSALAHLGRIGPRPWSLLVPVVAMFSLLPAALANDGEKVERVVSILLFWLVLMGNVAAHELGHVIGARLAGFPVARIIIGPAELRHTADGWRLELSREWISLLGGLVEVGSVPMSPRQLLLFASGGPLATILLLATVIAVNPFGVAALFSAAKPLQREVLSHAFTIAGAILVINLIPSPASALNHASDGSQILQALRGLRARRG